MFYLSYTIEMQYTPSDGDTTMKLSKANNLKVESIDLQVGEGFDTPNQYWVELNKGFCFPEKGTHCFGEDTQALVRKSLKMVIECDCEECDAITEQ
tara:strand:+ start:78 stop:365 length:288 start_codon:yes stop_codon:yes gene_type:complete